jgi:rhamnulokinase
VFKLKYTLAIDIGASSGRHILGYMDNGKMVLEEIYRFPNYMDGVDEHKVWDTKRLFNEILEGLKKAKELNKIPETVGIDTWGVDYALLDKDDNLLEPVYAYRDSKNAGLAEDVSKIIPFEDVYASCGIEFADFNTIYQLYGDKLSGKMDKAETFLTLPDYFNFLLTGVKKQEYTDATTTSLININTHTWDYDIIEKLGYKKSLFNDLSVPGSVVGKVSDKIADILGYKPTVVLPATHDTASAVLAVPDGGNKEAYISSGTWSLMGVENPVAITKEKFNGKAFSNEGSVDYNFRVQTNIMGMWIFQNVKKEFANYSFTELTDMAENSTYQHTFDVNDKSFFAPQSMLEAINNYFVKNNVTPPESIGDVCRSIFLSLAECYAKTIEGVSNVVGKKFNALHIIGGGSQNMLLNKFTAKSTKLPVIAGPTEATAIGNIAVQLVYLNEIESLSDAKNIIKKSFDIYEV